MPMKMSDVWKVVHVGMVCDHEAMRMAGKGHTMNTIGQMIGKVAHTFATRNDQGETVQTTQTFDFTTASDDMVKGWLISNRVIARQVPMRKLTAQEMKSLHNKTVKAEYAGHKIVSREEQVKQFEAAGIPRALAEVAVDNPDLFKEVMEKTANDVESDKS